jgi:hypothetical protein
VRAPARRHPRRDQRLSTWSAEQLKELSEKVQYTISAEHKGYPILDNEAPRWLP